MKNPSFQV